MKRSAYSQIGLTQLAMIVSDSPGQPTSMGSCDAVPPAPRHEFVTLPMHVNSQHPVALDHRPRIEAVFDQGRQSRRYTPGGMFRVIGAGFGDFADLSNGAGLYLATENSSCLERLTDGVSRSCVLRRAVRAFRILTWRDRFIEGIWPVGFRGPQRLVIEAPSAGGTPRVTVWPHLLAP